MSTEDKPNQNNEIKAVQNEVEIPELSELEQNSLELSLKRLGAWIKTNSTKISWAVLILSCAFLIYSIMNRSFIKSQSGIYYDFKNTSAKIATNRDPFGNLISVVSNNKEFATVSQNLEALADQTKNETIATKAALYLGMLYSSKAEVSTGKDVEKYYQKADKAYDKAKSSGDKEIVSKVAISKLFIKLNLGKLDVAGLKKELKAIAQNPSLKGTTGSVGAANFLNYIELNKDFKIGSKLAVGKAKWQIDEENKSLEAAKKARKEMLEAENLKKKSDAKPKVTAPEKKTDTTPKNK